MTVPDYARARAIVALAAAEPSAAQEWLRRDERGSWERTALDYLAKLDTPAVQAKLAARPMTDAQVNEEIAGRLRLEALEAMLADARKREPLAAARRRRR